MFNNRDSRRKLSLITVHGSLLKGVRLVSVRNEERNFLSVLEKFFVASDNI